MRLRRFLPGAVLAGCAGLVAAVLVATLVVGGNGQAGAAVRPDRCWRHCGPSPTPRPSPTSPSPTPSGPVLSRAQIVATMRLVDGYWLANGTGVATNNWQNATFNVGNLRYEATAGVTDHATLNWCQGNNFALSTDSRGQFFPDPFSAGEVYLDLQAFYPDPTDLTALRGRIAAEVSSVAAGTNSYWNYVDALNMAMPSLARLGVRDNSAADLSTMETLFSYTKSQLFNASTGLWWRDQSFVGTSYWARGNGWAAMAMAKVLAALPASDPRRPEYVAVLTAMADSLRARQRSDGFWNSDLGATPAFPGPETSGTAFFTYALTWGINHGILPAASYRPVVERAWQGMVSKAVRGDGLLGYVQGPSTKPATQTVGATETAAYGVGGFLLAGSELAALEP